MPPFLFAADDEDDEPEQGAPEDAVPALEALAANNGLRDLSLRRFEADEPPPYESSTEPEDFGHHHDLLDPPPPAPIAHDSHATFGDVPDDVLQTLERPLSDEEMESIATAAHHLLSPAEVFYGDALREDERMPFSESFKGTVGLRRAGLVVRHVLKNRWKKLGVWNDAWGFAGRNVAPEDRYRDWRWPWERQGADEREAVEAGRKELVLRALRQRQHLRRGEHVPGPAQAHLEPDSSIAQAESFLVSRPWFLFRLERFEDTMRHNRLDQATRLRHKGRLGPSVKERWQARGEWRREFGLTPGFDIERVTAWKWRHESPSPEPEDLGCITKPLQPVSLRRYHDDLRFTPSEYDEIEVLERMLEDRPENSWIVQDSDFDQPPIPGQVHREIEGRGPIFPSADSGQNGEPGTLVGMSGGGLLAQGQGIFGRALNTESPAQPEPTDEPKKPENEESPEDAGEPEELGEAEELPLAPPTNLEREQSKQSDRASSPPAPRQSARAAAASRKREAEAPLPEPEPPKRARRTTKATPAAVPTTTAAKGKKATPASSSKAGGAKRGRPAGRPRKSLVPASEPLPETEKKEALVKEAAETPARRGRPPKEQPETAPSTSAAKPSKKAAAAAKPAARRGRPSKSVTPDKPSVTVIKAKQRVTAKVAGKRGRPSAKSQASGVEKPTASGAKRNARSAAAAAAVAAAAPQETPRRGRPSRVAQAALAQTEEEQEEPSTTAAKATKKRGKQAAVAEEPVAPRRAGRPARAAPKAAVPAKSEQTAPKEEASATPNRRGRPAKATPKTAPTAVAEKKSVDEETTPAKEENATPRRGRPSKAQGLEKKVANAAVAATAALAKSNQQQVVAALEEDGVPTPRRGRPSKAATLAAAAAKAEDDKPSAPEEEVATPRARGRPEKKAATPTAVPVPEKKSNQQATLEEGVDTPRRRGRPARQQPAPQSQEEDPAPTPAPAAAKANGISSAAKKKKAAAATPNKKAAAATPLRSSNRVTKRTAVTNSSSSKSKATPTASPAGRGRGRPKRV
ncbi:hypothetical protein PG985_009818 [Apiospora marii]|uniref:uncharacterized protein n=1 Tax=Apiospora marii TaxID=335849 RepID=UPI00312F14A6